MDYDSMVGDKYHMLYLFYPVLNMIYLQYNPSCYHPAWTLLAWDYLAVMSSSVFSKHAFSQGGIIISKCCNSLKEDIMEALQCIKCAIQHNLLFQQYMPSTEEAGDSSDEKKELDELTDVGVLWTDMCLLTPLLMRMDCRLLCFRSLTYFSHDTASYSTVQPQATATCTG
jgi:hAT family C-terminal dimerisation region